jgi:hypothetical protein
MRPSNMKRFPTPGPAGSLVTMPITRKKNRMLQSVWSEYKLGAHPMAIEPQGRQSDPESLKHTQTRLFVWHLSAGTCKATSISGTIRSCHKDNQLPFSSQPVARPSRMPSAPRLTQIPHRSDNERSMSRT